jgi:hypothetical protein
MAFVDGTRCRWHGLSQKNKTDEGAATKLILLLLPPATSRVKPVTALNHLNTCNPRLNKIALNLEALGDTDWDVSGVAFLIGRLSEAFALGGQEFQNVEPFAVKFGIFDVRDEKEEAELQDAYGEQGPPSLRQSTVHQRYQTPFEMLVELAT